MEGNNYYIFTDGSSSKKRKSIGAAFVIYNSKKEIIYKKSFGFQDSKARIGVAELIAIYSALIKINQMSLPKGTNVIIYSDSQYCVNELNIWFKNQLIQNFYNTKNKDIIIYLLYFLDFLREYCGLKIELKWIRGHQNIKTFESEGNSEADFLATECHKAEMPLKNSIEDLICKIIKFVEKEKCLKIIRKIYLQ